MKKIGIITFHRANNLGAVLQTSALYQFINENIGKTEVIDFIPNNLCILQSTRIKRVIYKIKYILYSIKNPQIALRDKRFNEYRAKEFLSSDETVYGDNDTKKIVHKYDVLVSGSDQIFNTSLSGCSKTYYLSFDDDAKKVSYASSFGRNDITNDEIHMIESELIKFYALSFREESGKNIVEKLIGCKGTLVVDPVFLLTAQEWEKKERPINRNKKYIFLYAMENTPEIKNAIEVIKNQTNLPVIAVMGGSTKVDINDKILKCCGPREFLAEIRNAEFVVTNSFHGTAFSMIFGKKLICVPHSCRNSRLENILAITDNIGKLAGNSFSEDNYSEFIIDGLDAYKKLEKIIGSSKDYLNRYIGNC